MTETSVPEGAQTQNVESVSPLEQRDTAEKVVGAFSSAFSILESTPDTELTEEERWAKRAILSAKEKTIDQNKSTFTNTFEGEGGEVFSQEEGIPIEDLLSFLRKKADSLPPDSEERQKIINWAHTLYRNSKSFSQFPHRMEPPRYLGRVRQEAYFISRDTRATGDPQKDWLKAVETLNKRIELVIPPREQGMPQFLSSDQEQLAPQSTTEATSEKPASSGPETSVPPETAAPQEEAVEQISQEDQRAMSIPQTLEQVRRELFIVNRTEDIRKRAAELAEEQLRNEMRRGSAWNPLNWPRKIGLRIMEEFYRQRYINRATEAMIRNNNAYLTIDLVRNAAVDATHRLAEERAAGKAKIEQIKTGEQIEGQQVVEAQGALRDMLMNEIIRPVVNGSITQEGEIQQKLRDFVQAHESDPQVQAVFGRDANQYGRLAEYFATDLLETARAVREDLSAHRYAIEQLGEVAKIKLANTSWAAQTQARFNIVDRAIAWAEKHRLTGVLINPATIGATFSLGTFGLMRTTGFGARVAQFVVPGAGLLPGAAFAALRRNYDLKVDRAAHQVERAYGRQIPPNARRREALERFAYNMASVSDLLNGGGNEALSGAARQSLQTLLSLDLSAGQISNREAVIRRIAEIKTRLDFSVREKVDLVAFAGREEVEQGRLELVKAIVQARQALRQAGMTDEEIRQMEQDFTGRWNQYFLQNREQQDRAFAHYRLRNAAGAAVFGGVSGVVGGLVGQEALAQIARHIPESAGMPVIGGLFGKGQTALERGVDWAGYFRHPELAAAPSAPTADTLKNLFTNGGTTEVGRYELVANPDHSVLIIDPLNKQPIPDMPHTVLNNDGKLSITGDIPSGFKEELQKLGFKIEKVTDTTALSEVKILEPSGTHIDTTVGHKTVIPNGTEWIKDPADPNKWDLIVSGHPDKVLLNDVQFDANGKITYDSAHSIITKDLVQQAPREISEPKPVLGPDGEWTKNATTIDHREWYSYDQPGSQGNELRLYTHKEGQSVILDITKMGLGYQKGLVPNPIDVQETIKNHEAGFYFSLPNLPQHGVFVSDGADGKWDGLLRLDPNAPPDLRIDPSDPNSMSLAEFSKIVLNETAVKTLPDGNIATELYNRQQVFNLGQEGKMGFIEAGRLVDRGGKKVLQAFATIRGASPTPETIQVSKTVFSLEIPQIPVTESIPKNIPVYEIVPPEVFEAPPVVPIPFAPRHPLEPLLFVYGYGGEYTREELGLLPWGEYKNRRSQRLIQNPDAVLDEKEEINSYLGNQPPEYRQELEQIDKAINKPMSEKTRVVFAIPAYEEGMNIRKTLEQLLNQKDKDGNPLDPSLFEIIILDNHPEDVPKDNTEAEVNAFKTEHPEINIIYVHKTWRAGEASVGNARKYANDLALLRSIKRQSQTGDLILVSNDADLEAMSPRYVSDVIDAFDSKKELDAIAGKWNLPEEALRKPNLRAAQRLWYILDRVIARDAVGNPDLSQLRAPGLVGRNAAFRASVYAAIGGYNPKAKLAEDLELGWMINDARGWNAKRIEYLNSAEIVSNPRRFLAAMAQGIPLIQMYGGFHENRDVRKLNNEQLLSALSDAFDVARFEKEVDAIWQTGKSGQYKWLGDRFDVLFARAMGLVGAEYRIEDGHVKITSVERLLEGLKRPLPTA